MRVARTLSVALAVLMVAQSLLGLALPHKYRDLDWIKATWFGNDSVTLVVAVPLLIAGLRGAARGSRRGLLLWLGMLGYGVYNYAFYLLGATLNVFFLIYVGAVVLAVIALITAMSAVDPVGIAAGFRPDTPARALGGCLVFIGVGLAMVWSWMWAAHVFAGHPTPVEPEAFQLVAALDLSVMVPALTVGGVLLWRRRPWGFVISSVAGIQGSLYLLVLSVNSVIAIQRGLAPAPAELPIWGTLLAVTSIATGVLLANAERHASGVARVGPGDRS